MYAGVEYGGECCESPFLSFEYSFICFPNLGNMILRLVLLILLDCGNAIANNGAPQDASGCDMVRD